MRVENLIPEVNVFYKGCGETRTSHFDSHKE